VTDDRRTGDRGPTTGGRGQMTDDGGPGTDDPGARRDERRKTEIDCHYRAYCYGKNLSGY